MMEGMDDDAVETASILNESLDAPVLVDEDEKPKYEQPPNAPQGNNVLPASQESKSTTHLYLDDVDRMLCHEDFASLLALAVRVKEAREAIAEIHGGSVEPRRTASEMDPNQVINAVTRMQQQHVLRNYQDNVEIPVIRRGTYHMTDSLLNENFHILQQEMERCNNWMEAAKEQERKLAAATVAKKSKSEGEAIAVKYAKWQTDILMEWMLEHVEHPFPDADQMKELCHVTGLSHAQVVNWTTNMRKRSLKATVENGKKPHHFLDFAFLANDREKQHKERKMQQQQQGQQQQQTANHHKSTSSNRTKKKVVYTGMARQKGDPYATAIHGVPHHHGYQQGLPPPGHFQPHPVTSYYPMHPQSMMHPQGGYSHYPGMGHPGQHAVQYPYPTPVYSYAHHQLPHTSPQKEAQQYEEREDVEQLDDWDMKLQAVSDSFDDAVLEEFANGDSLLTFADYWGGDAQGDTRDDVHDNSHNMTEPEPELESIDMDALVEDMENEHMSMHDPRNNKEDPLSAFGRGDDNNGTALGAGHHEVESDGHFRSVEETSGTDATSYRQKRRTSSFSVDMKEFEDDLSGHSDMDLADFLVHV